MNTARVEQGYGSFDVILVGHCMFCGSTQQTNDHHCKDVDKQVNLMRNKLDDEREARGEPPAQWCAHDNVTKRRTTYKRSLKKRG